MPERVTDPVVLPNSGVLSDFNTRDLHLLSAAGQAWNIESGLKVIKEGDEQDCLYFIVKGSFDVYRNGADGPVQVAELGVADAFGEMNFLDRERASATVSASGPSVVWRMSRNEFYGFTDAHPQIAMQLFRALAVMVVGRFRQMLDEQTAQGASGERESKKRWWF